MFTTPWSVLLFLLPNTSQPCCHAFDWPYQDPIQLSNPEENNVIKSKDFCLILFLDYYFFYTYLSHRFGSDDWLNLCRISTIPMSRSLSWRSCEPTTINHIVGNTTKNNVCRTEERSGSRKQPKEGLWNTVWLKHRNEKIPQLWLLRKGALVSFLYFSVLECKEEKFLKAKTWTHLILKQAIQVKLLYSRLSDLHAENWRYVSESEELWNACEQRTTRSITKCHMLTKVLSPEKCGIRVGKRYPRDTNFFVEEQHGQFEDL